MGLSMAAQLLSLTGGASILLEKPIVLIGRHPECDIQIDSRKISRRHCCIAQVGDYLVIRDLGSTNGVRINGVRVQEGKLKPSDELMIGAHRYRVDWDGVPTSAVPAMAEEQVSPPAGSQPVLDHPGLLGDPADLPTDGILDTPMAEPIEEPSPIVPDDLHLTPSRRLRSNGG
jgi:pSer/pThr/pTyr-binding forkhead associated (FHA) protein